MVAGNDDLHPLVKRLHQTVSRIREDVQTATGELEKIRELVQRGFETVRDAIQESIQAQAELKLMEHVMEAKAVNPQIEAEYDQIETERAELEERLDAVGERYQRKHEDLDETAQERIRELGSHIFELQEEQFEEGVEEPFTGLVTTTWSGMQAANEEVREERTEKVTGVVGEAVQAIHDFVDRQRELLARIDDRRLADDEHALLQQASESSSDEDGDVERFQVPYYVVEYEEAGVSKREVVAPSNVTSASGSEWCSVGLSSIEGAADLVDGHVPSDGRTETMRPRDVQRVGSEGGDSSVLGFSYADALDASMPDEALSVTVEGGER